MKKSKKKKTVVEEKFEGEQESSSKEEMIEVFEYLIEMVKELLTKMNLELF